MTLDKATVKEDPREKLQGIARGVCEEVCRWDCGGRGSVRGSDAHGLPPLEVEAAAFAWLARQLVLRKQGNLPSVTGAQGLRLLGAVYPA